MPAGDSVVLMGVGDVGPVHGDMAGYATHVASTFATADVVFAQCERLYSAGARLEGDGYDGNFDVGHGPLPADMISVFTSAGFDIVSMAGNHTMEFGADVALETAALFEDKGIRVVGFGRNLREACAPVIVERNAVRVALLAYCSVLRDGHEATDDQAGVAPMRASTSYEKVEWQAGMPMRAITEPNGEDIARMVENIAQAKADAHVVVVSLHWGLHYIPRVIADYQPVVARAAFDAGADLILGHHPHVPKAIEMFGENRACFYSLGNFMFSTNTGLKPGFVDKMRRYSVAADLDEYPNCPHGEDSHRSLIVNAELSPRGVEKVSFLPVQIAPDLRPEVLAAGDPQFDKNVAFMDWASKGYDHHFAREGDEVVVAPAAVPAGT